MEEPSLSSDLIFFVNGTKVVESSPNPEWTLLYYLRSKLRLSGTKEACGEGGCGACTVLQQQFNEVTGKIENNAINACLTPLCSVHGTAIITVEGIGSTKTGLHPVQERIAKSHGTQCGFCTPGFVMSMYALLRNNPHPTEQEMEDAFQGNLCRCTGYRPILQGFQTFCKPTPSLNGCCGGKKNGSGCCMDSVKNEDPNKQEIATTLFNANEFQPYDPKQDIIFPPELQMDKSIRTMSLIFKGANVTWFKPSTLEELLVLKSIYPNGKIVGGFTEVGIEVRFKQNNYPVLIYVSDVPDLKTIKNKDNKLVVGGAVTLSALKRFCSSLKSSRNSGTVLKAIEEMLQWFAGQQIRNVATIAGNIVTASPISDLNPILMACGAKANLISLKGGRRTVPMDQSFFPKYRTTVMQPSEIFESVEIPLTPENEFISAFKQARRREDDIAIVNACMRVTINPKDLTVTNASLVFGGMAPTTKFAKKTGDTLVNRKWDHETLELACNELMEEMKLEPNAPGGMSAYRQVLTQSFLTKFYITVSSWISMKLSSSDLLSSKDLSATTPISHPSPSGVQLYQIVPQSQKVEDLVGRPVVHLSGIKHATGEAIYTNDELPLEGQLYAALVPSPIAHGKILKIDATKALALPGVVDFLSAKSLSSEENAFGYGTQDEEVFASEFVRCQGQCVGMILADDPFTAEKASKLVEIQFEELPVILTIEQAISQNSYYGTRKVVYGDTPKALVESDVVIEGEMRIGGQEHFYMETQCCTAIPGEDQELDMIVSCQGPDILQGYIAKILNIPQNRVRIRCRRMGGSFGGKESRCLLVAVPTALAAVKLGRPIRTVMTRWEDMMVTGGRNPFLFKYKVGVMRDTSKITAVDAELYSNAGHSTDSSLAVMEKCLMAVDGPYTIPNWNLRGWVCKTNLASSTAFRGYGGPQASILMESVMDSVAEGLGMDPVELRRRHLKREDGHFIPLGYQINGCSVRKCWDECLKGADYEKAKERVEEWNGKNKWKKRGLAVMPMKHGVGFKKNAMNQAGALVMIYGDGSVGLNHGGTEMGQGLLTKMVQVASRALGGVGVEKIYFSESSTDKVPNATATCGSFSSDLNGMAVIDACNKLRKRLEPFKKGNPEGKWEDWVREAYMQRVNLSAVGFYEVDLSYDFSKPEDLSREPFLYLVYGVAVTEVEVDCLTGDHSVLRTDIVIDAGESLNPAVDIGQIEGAFMQGYGLYTMEELVYSPKGLLLSKGPGMYKIPAMGDIPREFNVSLLRGAPKNKAVYSSKGLGEPPLMLAISVYMAIKEAIKAARKERGLSTSFRLDCPATVEKIRMAFEDESVKKVNALMEDVEKIGSPEWSVAI